MAGLLTYQLTSNKEEAKAASALKPVFRSQNVTSATNIQEKGNGIYLLIGEARVHVQGRKESMAAILGNDLPQWECVLNMRVGVSECVPFCLYVCIKECGRVYVAVCM